MLFRSTAFISPFRSDRRLVRDLLGDGDFIEIFVDTPLEVCESRDPKGLYKKAREGLIRDFTGIDSPYEAPQTPELVLRTVGRTPDDCADELCRFLVRKGILKN